MAERTSYPRLLGDVGATNARFAWQAEAGAAPSAIAVYACGDYPGLLEAIEHYLRALAQVQKVPPRPRWGAIGIADPVTGDRVQMTNHDWSFSISEVERALGLERLLVINDFMALALALPLLGPSDVRQIGAGSPAHGAPIGLLGPGTGLGVSGLIPAPNQGMGTALPLSGEGGHVTLAPADGTEARIIERLRERFGHASAERALSGPGLVNLHEAVSRLNGAPAPALSAAQITSQALAGSDAGCVQAVELFFSFLGNVAGNLALTLGARGGVYIGGGIVPRLGDWIDRSRFRERFADKGRFKPYLGEIPTYLVTAETSPALLGAARALALL